MYMLLNCEQFNENGECCRQPRIGKLLNCISLIFWTGYNTLGNVYAFLFFGFEIMLVNFCLWVVSVRRPSTRPGQLDGNDLSERAIFSVSVLSMFIRAIFAFKCHVFVIFVPNVISRLIRCAYFCHICHCKAIYFLLIKLWISWPSQAGHAVAAREVLSMCHNTKLL